MGSRPFLLLVSLSLAGLPYPVTLAQSIASPSPALVNVKLSSVGELLITPSTTSSAHDFDFLAGQWVMQNQRLKSRLTHSTEWLSYASADDNLGSVLHGLGNLDRFTTRFNPVSDSPYEGLTLRLFNPKTKLWSLYWVDSNSGVLDPPVVGSFEGSIGRFYGKDIYAGQPILVLFTWDKTDAQNPVWSQSFSTDQGQSWETNHINVSHRVK